MIEIEKNVPLPPRKAGRPSSCRYPFADMEVGDCFTITHDGKKRKDGSTDIQSSISAMASQAAKKLGTGVKFATRTIDATTIRCWRIA